MAYTYPEHKACQVRESGSLVPATARSARNGVAEAEQLGRPPDGIGGHCASFFNEFLLLDQPAEVLLVDQPACERLNTALQLQQGEFGRHQLEYHRTVFDLGAQPRDAGRENAAMIRRHRLCPARLLPRGRARDRLPVSATPPRAVRSAAAPAPSFQSRSSRPKVMAQRCQRSRCNVGEEASFAHAFSFGAIVLAMKAGAPSR